MVKTVLQERISERGCEQVGFLEVPKISSQGRVLQRTMDQTLSESGVKRLISSVACRRGNAGRRLSLTVTCWRGVGKRLSLRVTCQRGAGRRLSPRVACPSTKSCKASTESRVDALWMPRDRGARRSANERKVCEALPLPPHFPLPLSFFFLLLRHLPLSPFCC